jgi:deoxyhypusine synthase
MVYAEATSVVPLIISYIYHKKDWEKRKRFDWSKLFQP